MSVDQAPLLAGRKALLEAVRAAGAPAYVTDPLCARIVTTYEDAFKLLDRSDHIRETAEKDARAFVAQAVELGFLDAYPNVDSLRGDVDSEGRKP